MINITALDAICADEGRYATIFGQTPRREEGSEGRARPLVIRLFSRYHGSHGDHSAR
jgi:hypothetical protein